MLSRRFATSIGQFWKRWKRALTGPLFTISLLIYQQVEGKSPTWSWFIAFVALGFAWQFYDELIRLKKRAQPEQVPQLYLQYVPEYASLTATGFVLRTEDDRPAFNVKMTSEETVGDDHVRLSMEWEQVNGPIGKTGVGVVARCMYQKNNRKDYYSANLGDQLNLFFKHKKEYPDELIVVIEYTDAGGNACTARKFRISRPGDIFKDKISCQPVGNALTS